MSRADTCTRCGKALVPHPARDGYNDIYVAYDCPDDRQHELDDFESEAREGQVQS